MKLCRKHILLIEDLLNEENDFKSTCSPLLHCERNSEIVCDGDRAVFCYIMKNYFTEEDSCALRQNRMKFNGFCKLISRKVIQGE